MIMLILFVAMNANFICYALLYALFVHVGLLYCYTTQILFQRASVTCIDNEYLDYGNITVVRYGRKSGYYLNIEGQNKAVWGNNMTLHLVFYEFLHNEYRRSFIEMHFKVCDLINSDPYLGKSLARTGLTCPILPGIHRLMNITILLHDFPYSWPFEKCKIEAYIQHAPSKTIVAKGFVYLIVKQKNNRKKN